MLELDETSRQPHVPDCAPPQDPGAKTAATGLFQLPQNISLLSAQDLRSRVHRKGRQKHPLCTSVTRVTTQGLKDALEPIRGSGCHFDPADSDPGPSQSLSYQGQPREALILSHHSPVKSITPPKGRRELDAETLTDNNTWQALEDTWATDVPGS